MAYSKHIFITGASSGLGAALALAYSGDGVHLTLHGRNMARLESVATLCEQKKSTITIIQGDVADRTTMARTITEIDRTTPIDLIIANAGISAGTGGGVESPDQSKKIFDINLNGVLNTIHPIIPAMVARGAGQIAIISSIAGFIGLSGSPSYCASKSAVRLYGEALRGDMARHNIRVNVVCPGFIKTPMTDVNPYPMPFIMSPEKAAQIIKDGLAKNQARIAFPVNFYLFVRLVASLPAGFIAFLMKRFALQKPAL